MSFKCDDCNTVQNGKPIKVIVEKRDKVYPIRRKDPLDIKSAVIDKGGKGWEIVKEIEIGKECRSNYGI